MSRAKLAEEIKALLPEEKYKRVRQAIMRAYGGASGVARAVKNEIDQENRLRTGLLNSGTITISSATSVSLDLFAWVHDYVISQPAPATITILAPHASVPRTDYFTGKIDGTYGYHAGTVDAQGNAFPPAIPDGEILLRYVVRNPDGTNVIDDSIPDYTDAVSKSATAPQSIKSPLNLEFYKGAIQNLLGTDPNGTLRLIPPARAGIYTTLEGSGGWSKMMRITIDPALQINYVITFQMLGVTPDYEKGDMWCVFRIDAGGDIILNSLKLFGEFTPERYKLIKVDATHYELFLAHDQIDSLYSFRPIMLFGNDWRYEFFHQSPILAALPAGSQHSFSIHKPKKEPKFGIEYGGHIIYSGTGLRYDLDFTGYHIYTEDIIKAENQFAVLDTGNATHDRIDVLYLDINGLQVVKGTPSADPQQPSMPDPANNIFLTFILVRANATTPGTDVNTIKVYDENLGSPNEYVATFAGAGTTNYANTANVASGTISADVSNVQAESKMIFTSDIDIVLADIDTISFYIMLKATMNSNRNVSVQFFDINNLAVSSRVDVALDKASTAYQLVGLSKAQFQFYATNARKLQIIYTGSGGPSTFAGWYLDVLKIQKGVQQPTLPGEKGDNGWSPVLATVSDGERRVHQVIDWIGGEGTKPATGSYIGIDGLKTNIADGVDIRGPKGADGTGGGSAGLADLVGFPVIPFDNNYRHAHQMAGPVEISVDTSKPRTFPNHTVLYVKADGTNKPTFKTSDNFSVVYDGWNNTAGEWNRFRIEWSPQGNPVVQIMDTSGAANPGTAATDFMLLFDADYSFSHVIAGTVSLSVDATGALYGKKTLFYFRADGVNKPMWNSPIEANFDNYINVDGVWNRFYLEWTPENKVTLQIQNT